MLSDVFSASSFVAAAITGALMFIALMVFGLQSVWAIALVGGLCGLLGGIAAKKLIGK